MVQKSAQYNVKNYDKLRHDLRSEWLKDFHTEEQSPMEENGEWGPPWSKSSVAISKNTRETTKLCDPRLSERWLRLQWEIRQLKGLQ